MSGQIKRRRTEELTWTLDITAPKNLLIDFDLRAVSDVVMTTEYKTGDAYFTDDPLFKAFLRSPRGARGAASCRSSTVAEVKQPLVEITQSPATVVLSVCLAARHPCHYHKGQICSANGILHTHTHTHTYRQHPPKMPTQHLTQIRAFQWEHLQDKNTWHTIQAHINFIILQFFWLQDMITWLE